MAKLGKTNAGSVPDSVPSLKSKGLKNPMPSDMSMDQSKPDMSKNNDKPGKAGTPPASKKKDPTE
jgi:hypothetical protein